MRGPWIGIIPCLLLSACQAVPRDDGSRAGSGGLYVQALAALALSLDTEADGIDPPGGIGPPELHSEQGLGLAAGYRFDVLGLGILALASEHSVRDASSSADFETGFLEVTFAGEQPGGFLPTTSLVGLGLGYAAVDFEDRVQFESASALAVEGRIEFGLLLRSYLSLDAGYGYISAIADQTVGNARHYYVALSLRP